MIKQAALNFKTFILKSIANFFKKCRNKFLLDSIKVSLIEMCAVVNFLVEVENRPHLISKQRGEKSQIVLNCDMISLSR